jgi:hypothetical protein
MTSFCENDCAQIVGVRSRFWSHLSLDGSRHVHPLEEVDLHRVEDRVAILDGTITIKS